MSEKSKSTAFLLCYFLGLLGAHRFYIKRKPSGLLMLALFVVFAGLCAWSMLNTFLTGNPELLASGGLMMLAGFGGLGVLTLWWMVDSVLLAAGYLKDGEGNALRTGPPDPDNPAAGFWVRLAAMSVDSVILSVAINMLLMAMAFVLPLVGIGMLGAFGTMGGDGTAMGDEEQAMMGALFSGGIGLIFILVSIGYFAVQYASKHQATIGKRCFDLYLVAGDGDRVGLLRAIWRTICYGFSALPLYLGFVLAALTPGKRALHDFMAGTRVRHVDTVAVDDISSDNITVTNPLAAPGPVPESVQAHVQESATVDKSDKGGTALMAVGALLLAGAAAVALLL